MNTYIARITPFVDNLIIQVKKPNMAYIEAMSSLTQAVTASIDSEFEDVDLSFVYEVVLSNLKQLQDCLPSMNVDEGFENTLKQLIDLHIDLLAA